MNRWATLTAIALLALASQAAPQSAMADIVPTKPSACTTAVTAAGQINGFALFRGSLACAQEGRQEDTNFLIVLGQIRTMADLTILTPTDDQNATKAGQLYGQLFYQFGGVGFEALYRMPAYVSGFEARVRSTALLLSSGYDPGWSYRSSSKIDVYASMVSGEVDQRLWQISNLALKLQNNDYFAVNQQIAALQRDNPVFQQGTPAGDKLAELSSRLADIAKTIPELPPPVVDAHLAARLNEQDPDVAARQLVVGFNGPASGETDIFRSEAEVRQSWLVKALSAEQLKAMLSRTDFSKQLLVSYSFSRYTNASGKVVLKDLAYHEGNKSYSVSASIGVVPETCGVSSAVSYPFVVGVVQAVPGARITASGLSNFPADCGPIVSGEPTSQP